MNRILRLALIMICMAVLLLVSCSAAATPAPRQSAPAAAEPPAADANSRFGAPQSAPASGGASGVTSSESTAAAQAAQRIVIKKANLSLVVVDPPKAMDTISAMADSMGGFVVSANQYQIVNENGVASPHATITIRIPAERLNEALGKIKALSERLPLNETIDSQDVTSEYTDLQSRLRNLEATETQLTKIMDSATKTEDVMSVYNQLTQVREQIEVLKGQIKFYEQSAALSSILVDLAANEAVQPLTIGGWQPVGVAKSAIQALINTVKFLANALIWIIIFILPVLVILYLVFILPVSLVLRAWRRRRAQRREAARQANPPPNPPAAPPASPQP